MNHRINDKVYVREDLIVGRRYGISGTNFSRQMEDLKGKTLRIQSVNGRDQTYHMYGGYGFLFTDEMLCTLVEDFAIEGSYLQLAAMKEAVEKIGWSFHQLTACFTEERCKERKRRLEFLVEDKKTVIAGEFCFKEARTITKKFTLPEQFNEALTYAKEASIYVKAKDVYPKYVKVDKSEGGYDPAFMVSEHCYKILKRTKKGFYLFENYKGQQIEEDLNYTKFIKKEEYDAFVKAIKTTYFTFGNLSFSVKNGVAICLNMQSPPFKITLKDVEGVIDWRNNLPTMCSHALTIELGGPYLDATEGTKLTDLINSNEIGFGCCRDTWGKVEEFYEVLKKSVNK